MESLFIKQRFLNEIRTTFGFGGLNCSLNDRELADFHNYIEKDFPFNEPGKTKRGVTCVGRQLKECGIEPDNIWVLNPSLHVDEEGKKVELSVSNYVWQPIGGPCMENTYNKTAVKVDIRSTIKEPMESHQSLSNLLLKMKAVLKHNFIPGMKCQTRIYRLTIHHIIITGLYTLGSAVMGLHFEILAAKQGGCPLPMLTGDPETGTSYKDINLIFILDMLSRKVHSS